MILEFKSPQKELHTWVHRLAAASDHYIEENKLIASKQSAYRRYHSCETATLKIMNDILLLDRKTKVILLLLDLSAAFDTV